MAKWAGGFPPSNDCDLHRPLQEMVGLINPTSVPHEKGEELELATCPLCAAWAGETPEYSALGNQRSHQKTTQGAERSQMDDSERLLEMLNGIFYTSFIPDRSSHMDLLQTRAHTRLSRLRMSKRTQESWRRKTWREARRQRPGLRQRNSPGSSNDKLTWSQRQHMRPGPWLGACPGGLAEAEMSALISHRAASPLSAACHSGRGPHQASLQQKPQCGVVSRREK